jgi:hypothetical protein
MTVFVTGLGGAFLKPPSICFRRCVVRYLEFEIIRVRGNRDLSRMWNLFEGRGG